MRVKDNLGRMAAGTLIAGFLVAVLMLPYAAAAGFGATEVASAVKQSDDVTLDLRAPELTTVTDNAGTPIASIYTQNRSWVPLAQMSKYLTNGIVAIEDRRFYQHKGVDWRGTARAALGQISGSASSGGGSTITQQYIKNYLFLVVAKTDAEKAAAIEVTPIRKLREARMAINLEQTHSKDQILEDYLNTVAFAPSVYGAQAAAQYFFGKNAVDLDLNEAAILAGMVNNPNKYNPFTENGPPQVQQRRDRVLDTMVRDGYISNSVSAATKALPLTATRHPKPNGCIAADNAATNGYFCQYVLDYLSNLPNDGGFTLDTLQAGGYTIKTTLDPDVMAASVAAVTANANPASPDTARIADVMAVVEPSTNPAATGRPVLALAVNRPYGLDQAQGQTVTRLATTFAPLGAGSTFKMFTAAAALEKSLGTDSIIDSPAIYTSPLAPTHEFKNASENYPATMTLQRALATSPNTAFVALEDQVGLADVTSMAVKLGLRGYNLPAGEVERGFASLAGSYADQVVQQKIASFTLGVSPVSPLELSNSGATVASNGMWCPPTPVASITDRDGNAVQWSQLACEQVVDPKLASSLAQAMEPDVTADFGTAHASLQAAGWGSRPAAGKTGTTEDYKSSAFLGFTPYYSGATIVFDYDNGPQPICRTPTLRTCTTEEAQGGQGMSGGSVPAKTWGDAMTPLHAGKENLDFPPATLQYQKGTGGTSVVNVIGQQVDTARATLAAAGYTVPDDYLKPRQDPAAAGTVLDQSPKSSAIPGAAVNLVVSSGPAG
ncbi:MAG: transglycosylase domain-containing protein [Nakamurella sp.]